MEIERYCEIMRSLISDEYLAAYQYSIGASVLKGVAYADVLKELEQHASDELMHADKLIKLLIHHGGIPPLSPADWFTESKVGYTAPEVGNDNTAKLLQDNVTAEEAAIKGYEAAIEEMGSDFPDTVNALQDNLTDEYTHAYDLIKLEPSVGHQSAMEPANEEEETEEDGTEND